MDFKPFPKIPRLSRECVITEKIDGTNVSIHILEDGTILYGSRNRFITPSSDNYGFAQWATLHKEELLSLGIGSHYGEWWGQGIQCGYGVVGKRFSLFNTSRWKDNPDLPECCLVVPELYRGPFDTEIITDILLSLEIGGSVAAPGFKHPEGIIIYHTAANHYFKKTIKNDHKPKGDQP